MNEILENIQAFGPMFAFFWAITIASVLIWPQRYFNSILLMGALLISLFFVAGLAGQYVSEVLAAGILLIAGLLFLVPVLLIINGIQMIRRESLCFAHALSLALGLFVGIGEIAAVIYALGMSDILNIPNPNYWVLLVAATVFYFSFLVLSFVLYSIFIQIMPHRKNFNYIIIHGCGLSDGYKPTKLLSDRIDKAISIYRKCREKPYIIPSGGMGQGELISESQAMTDYLLDKGIPADHIILEDKSFSTRENLLNSKRIIDSRKGRKKTALVSSNYHIYRCLKYAREIDFRCIGIGSRVAFYYWPSALIREFIAIFLTPKFLFWSITGYVLFISPLLYALL